MFEPKNGVMVLLLGAYFDPSLMAMARKAAATEDWFPAWMSVVEALGSRGAGAAHS
jgi:hypothetical protein